MSMLCCAVLCRPAPGTKGGGKGSLSGLYCRGQVRAEGLLCGCVCEL